MDAELEFAIQPNTTGKQLFDQVRTMLALLKHAKDFASSVANYMFLWCFSSNANQCKLQAGEWKPSCGTGVKGLFF